MNSRSTFVDQVIETALYFREMYEEDNAGMTTAIEWLKPVKSVNNKVVREYVLNDLYKARKLTLTRAALELAKWRPEGAQPLEFELQDIEEELTALCRVHERDLKFVSDGEEKIKRSYLRAARHMQRISLNKAAAHSRIVELFVPRDFVKKGGTVGAGHREHVVPCAALREESVARFHRGDTVEQVSEFLRRHVVIVEITKAQQKKLDGKKGGGLGLKDKMPPDWKFDDGCIFARLHLAEIDFTPPEGFSRCTPSSCKCAHGKVESR